MAKTPTPVLTCKECGYNNEPERVYCHNCGQKLDRSVLPKDTEVRRESPEQAQRRIRKMTNPGANPIAREGKMLIKTLIWAAVAACLVQMLREPSGVPAKNNELSGGGSVSDTLMALAESPQPRVVAVSEADVNYAIGKILKAKDSPIPGVVFDRAYAMLRPNEAIVGVQKSAWEYPIHAGIGVLPEIKNGSVSLKIVSGNIGRLPIHPALMEYVSYAFPFRQMAKGLKREGDYLAKLSDIRIEKGRMFLAKGGAPLPASSPVVPASSSATPAPAAIPPTPAPPAAVTPAQ